MILVTGATGFVGSALVRRLVEAGEAVRILRRPTSTLDLLGDAAGRVEHALGDVTDPDAVADAVRGTAAVVHVAAAVTFGGRRDRDRLLRVNVGGTATVVNAALAAGVGRLVHTSSIAALGRPEGPGARLDETASWSPSRTHSAYAESKHLAEMEVHRGLAEGLDAVIVSPALVFGPGRPGEGTMRIAERLRAGRLPAAPPGGTGVVDVEDVAAGLETALTLGQTGERYILSGQNLLWSEILSTLAGALGVEPPRRVLSGRALVALAALAEAGARLVGHAPGLTLEMARTAVRANRFSNDKARRELGLTFRPFTETAARLAHTLR